MASGLDALWIAFRLLHIGEGDEVLVQGNTYIASVMGVTINGATPVFIEPDEHYGMASRMDEIVDICKKHNLKLVEDCAQSHGACYKGKMTGSFGDIGCFSFYPSKNLGAFGDAGAITTNNPEIDKAARTFRNYGSQKRYYNEVVGANSRLDELQAALLRVRLAHLNELTEEKRNIANKYSNEINNPKIRLPKVADGATCVWHQYVITCDERDRLVDYLNEKEIGTIIHYPLSPHLQECYKYLGHEEGEFPITEKLANTVLSIPMYNGMTEEEQNYIIDAINAYK